MTVDLLRDGKKIDSAKVKADEKGNWSYKFEGLVKYDPTDGHECAYTVEEHEVEGYTSEVSGDATSGFTITNTKKENPPTPEKPEQPEKPSKPEQPKQPEQPSASDLPKTGDASWAASFACLGAAVLAIAVGTIEKARNRGIK